MRRCARRIAAHPCALPRQGRLAIVARFVNACWYLFKVAAGVALVGAVATGVYMYVRMDDEIRRHVEQFLAERYPDLAVSVGGARIVEGKGIAVYDLTLSDPAAPPGADLLLSIDELMLQCDVEIAALVRGAPDVQRVEIKHPRITLRRDRAGRWNIESLLPFTPMGGPPPTVLVRNGSLSVSDDSAPQTPPLTFSDIQLTMTPAEPAAGSPVVPGAWPAMRVEGTIGGPQAKRIEVHASAAGPNAPGQATFVVEQFQINAALLDWARPRLPALVQSTRVGAALTGQVTIAWANAATPPDVQAALVLSDGRVDDPRLPAPLTELTGRIVVRGQQQEVIDLHGKCGAATVAASLNRTGWGARAPFAVAARADNVTLDRPLYASLRRFNDAGLRCAGALCEQWDRFQPAGVVDATLQAKFDGVTWKPTATLVGRHLSFESDKFPYRLAHGTGTITFSPATELAPPLLELDVTARTGGGGGQPLHIVGQVFDPKPAAAGWAEITGAGVEIEQGMIDAIPQATCREVIGQLNPAGAFNLKWRIDRAQAGIPPQTSLQLDLTDVRVNYDRFPYPLRNIRGTVRSEENRWTFTNLASGGRRTVFCEGSLQPAAEGIELKLLFTAHAAPLDDELFEALAPCAPAAQQAWTELRPRGQVDLRAEVNYRTGEAKPRISVVIQPRPETTIRPKFFPYRMDEVAGTITYNDGQVALTGMRAQHDRTTIRTNGDGYFAPEGGWRFRLTGLTADQVTPEQDLVSALPEQLQKLVEHLRPSGSFSLHDGVLAFTKSVSEITPLEAEWDVTIECHQTDLQCGIELHNIHGSVRVQGRTDRGYSTGELALETVTFQDIQFTNVRGPLWVNESKCLLGRWATEAQQKPERRLTGNVYDGGWSSNAWVTFANLPEYRAEIHLVGADLRRLVVERFGVEREFTGKVDANLHLAGRGYKMESLLGDGDVHIRDANLYELSLLARLLKTVRTGAADKTAFTQSDIAFRIQGRDILLDQIDFLGDVVNLYGKGETDFDQNLTLAFSAVIGRHDYNLPFVKNLVQQANQQIVQMYVNGTLSDPQVTTEAFPGIAQMFQQIGSDLRNPLEAAEQRREEQRRLATQPQTVQ